MLAFSGECRVEGVVASGSSNGGLTGGDGGHERGLRRLSVYGEMATVGCEGHGPAQGCLIAEDAGVVRQGSQLVKSFNSSEPVGEVALILFAQGGNCEIPGLPCR